MPVNFASPLVLDGRGEILQALKHDPGGAIADITASFEQTRYNTIVAGATDILVPQPVSAIDLLRARAFKESAFVVSAAFEQSDIDEDARDLVQKELELHKIPARLLTGGTVGRLAVFQGLATKSYAKHQEMNLAGRLVMNYFVETARDSTICRYVTSGLGFMMHQLDDAWDRAGEANLEREIANVDWDDFPR